MSLISDPLYSFIPYTSPQSGESAATEQDLLDSPWMQRLRRVSQLQSARWVFPTGEHSRFTHSLGTMHNAGLFAEHLYPSLSTVCPNCPSRPYIVALCRITGLLHDIGHGPFSHFFDEAYLEKFSLNHEKVGAAIVLQKLAPLIESLRRTVSGKLGAREKLKPEYIAYCMVKDREDDRAPQWLRLLKPLFSGTFTADNTDYVNRDAYMCGIRIGTVDVPRLRYYTFFAKEGLVVHRRGASALNMFLLARWYLYQNIYFHRTVRAIDLQLQEIFAPTLEEMLHGNPLQQLNRYLEVDEWNLFTLVKSWKKSHGKKKRLAKAWEKIYARDLIWKVVFERAFSLSEIEQIGWLHLIDEKDLEQDIARKLRTKAPLRVDLATMDPRPLNPFRGPQKILIYDDQQEGLSEELTTNFLKNIPAQLVQFRVFTSQKHLRSQLRKALLPLLGEKSFPTSL